METVKLFSITGVCLSLLLAGCANVDQIAKRYEQVKYNDGVNFDEAKIIAQKTILASPYTDAFDVFHPQLILTADTDQYHNFWFVTFPAKDQTSLYEHVMVIDKRTGGIIRSSQYQPTIQQGFDWLIKN